MAPGGMTKSTVVTPSMASWPRLRTVAANASVSSTSIATGAATSTTTSAAPMTSNATRAALLESMRLSAGATTETST